MQAGLLSAIALHARTQPEGQLLHMSNSVSAVMQVSQDYLACLKDNTGDASKCRDLSKLYLLCRMDRYFYATTLIAIAVVDSKYGSYLL